MGLAWFDDKPLVQETDALRIGGLPLLGKDESWPLCQRCEVPMLFRAQIPLSLTSLVSVEDDSLLEVFECHHHLGDEACTEGRIIWTHGKQAQISSIPRAGRFDVVLDDLGPTPHKVLALATQVGDDLNVSEDDPEELTGKTLANNLTEQGADQIKQALMQLGAKASLVASAPTKLPFCYAARVVPFEDGHAGVRKTTLPPLGELLKQSKRTIMRGLLGGATPGYRDHAMVCDCGKQTRTAVRLLAHPDEVVPLGHAMIQVCLPCNKAYLFRAGRR